MDLVQCQFMTLIIVLLIINIGLVIGVFLKWNAARKYCKDGEYRVDFRRTGKIPEDFADDDVEIGQEYPFIVAILVRDRSGFGGSELHCGGAIVEKHWVLTAAHCVETLKGVPLDRVMVTGGSKVWRIAVNHEVDYMMHHKDFNDSFNNDVGLVKVKQPFSDAFEQPIKLAGSSYGYEANRTLVAVGWVGGFYKREVFRAHDVLRSVNVSIFDEQYCKGLYWESGEEISESMFCAGLYTGEKPACRFDSGGPVLDGDLLVGVVSWGMDCGKVDKPAVYTKISVFEKWIYDISGHTQPSS